MSERVSVGDPVSSVAPIKVMLGSFRKHFTAPALIAAPHAESASVAIGVVAVFSQSVVLVFGLVGKKGRRE